tara:strand:- start:25 stop:672 length:648 start_codon:yes stop_codon:yes gene_type:complete
MIREPIQSCESWISEDFLKGRYRSIAAKITTMLFQVNDVIYNKYKFVGIRLEDIKKCPKKTIPAICNWIGLEETESLYEMTVQGIKWWGDPTSPDYKTDGMDPFGHTSINRVVGSVFSERDLFILRTLFYPFSVRFGYEDENKEKFIFDLENIRPMLDDLFDFEKVMVSQGHLKLERFKKSGNYLFFRSRLIERWSILHEHNTYPKMIQPLYIRK